MRIRRYGRWTGAQDPIGAELSTDEVLDEVADDLLDGWSPDDALRQLTRRGLSGGAGLDELRKRVEAARRRELERMGLQGPLSEIADRLAKIMTTERTALELSDAPDAVQRAADLDALPDDVVGQIRGLEDHQWEDARAEAAYNELVEELRRDVAEATFGRLAAALGSMDAEDTARMRDLLADLNALVAKRDRGEDVTDDFAAFKQDYADVLGDLAEAATLEDLLAELARRQAAMSSLMAGMSDEQRSQLADLAGDLFDDAGLAFEAGQLSRALQREFPDLSWGTAPPGAMPTGDETGSLSDTVDWVEHLSELDDLAQTLGQQYPGARLEDVDEELLRRTAGDDAVRDLRKLREIEQILTEAGATKRRSGNLELTPRGVRLLGERSLARIYDQVAEGEIGGHRTSSAGGEGEPTGATRPLRFGDPFRVDVTRTVTNAVVRRAGEGVEPGAGGLALTPDDFELAEAERRARAVTVLLLDMSFSMPLRGNWGPAKRVALALESLVSSKFPEDEFFVVGFSDYARRLDVRDLLVAGWERVYGTNMEHAFVIARRLLGSHPAAERQVIMITDGEPTAHLEGDQPVFAWPPEPETLRRTMAAAQALARARATLNVFLLDHDPGAAAYVEHMVGTVGGRIFYPDLDELGGLVMRDFLYRRR